MYFLSFCIPPEIFKSLRFIDSDTFPLCFKKKYAKWIQYRQVNKPGYDLSLVNDKDALVNGLVNYLGDFGFINEKPKESEIDGRCFICDEPCLGEIRLCDTEYN